MPPKSDWIPSSEAAFIAALTDKAMHRVVDDGVLPPVLYELGHGRRFAKVAGAFARFYFDAGDRLTKSTRREVIEVVTQRILQREDCDQALALNSLVEARDWRVDLPFITVNLQDIAALAQQRAGWVLRANRVITEDPDIMGGVPVFVGTRVPVNTVLGSVAAGASIEQVMKSYPFLTPQLLEDAQVFIKAYPRRGRPRKLGDVDGANPSWAVVSRKTVRAGLRRA